MGINTPNFPTALRDKYFPFGPLLLAPWQQFEKTDPAYWKRIKMTPMILAEGNGDWMYSAETSEAFIEDIVSIQISPRIRGKGWYLAIWSNNLIGNRCFLHPDHTLAFETNLRRLCSYGRKFGMLGLMVDFEYYPATKGLSGGPMNKNSALKPWPVEPNISRASGRIGQILKEYGMVFGGYVAGDEIAEFKGLREWIKGITKYSGKGLLLTEDYTGRIADDPGRLVNCYSITGFKDERANEALARRAAWVYDDSARYLPSLG